MVFFFGTLWGWCGSLGSSYPEFFVCSAYFLRPQTLYHLLCSNVMFSCVWGSWCLFSYVTYPSRWGIINGFFLFLVNPLCCWGKTYLSEVATFLQLFHCAFLARQIWRCSSENGAPNCRHGLLCPAVFCFWGRLGCCCVCGRWKRRCCWLYWLAVTSAIWLSRWDPPRSRPGIARCFSCPLSFLRAYCRTWAGVRALLWVRFGSLCSSRMP